MLVGCCASMIDPSFDPIGVECIEPLAEFGYDYIELSLSHLVPMHEDFCSAIVERLCKSKLPCLACNNFFPATLRLTGPEANLKANLAYAETAIQRASQLGAKKIVFGSSGAKNVPSGFPLDKAWTQIRDLLKQLGPIAQKHNLIIAIEPISRPESNIVLTAAEGLDLMQEVDHPNIRLLIDYYHLRTEDESESIVLTANDAIHHVHLATSDGRRFPKTIDEGMESFLQNLRAIDYRGGISIEAYTNHFYLDASNAIDCLKQQPKATK